MTCQVPCPGWLLLLLLLGCSQGRAKTLAEVQSLSKLLGEDLEPPRSLEEVDQEQDGSLTAGALDQPDAVFPWARSLQDEGAFQQLFGELLSSARRHQPRSKKWRWGGCFGAKLDRIGALSRLGC